VAIILGVKVVKKLFLILIALIILMFFAGCATPPVVEAPTAPEPAAPPVAAPPVAPPPAAAPVTPVEQAFYEVYQQHIEALILTGARTHTVVSGDTLAGIARSHYDDGFLYPIIMLASSAVVLDPDRIVPGMVLTIPDLQVNMNNPGSRATIVNFMMEMAVIEDSRNRASTAAGIRLRAGAM